MSHLDWRSAVFWVFRFQIPSIYKLHVEPRTYKLSCFTKSRGWGLARGLQHSRPRLSRESSLTRRGQWFPRICSQEAGRGAPWTSFQLWHLTFVNLCFGLLILI